MPGVITLTTGASGSGKSYARCAVFLVDDFLVNEDGHVWTNFPIGPVPSDHTFPPQFEGETFIDRIAETVAEKRGCHPDDVRERLHVIPADVLKSWIEMESGPWDYFADKDIDGAHIALDEIHNYYAQGSLRAWKKQWQAWLGEVRHQGASAELLTQSPGKVAREAMNEIEVRYLFTNSATNRDPIFKILIGDWYELRAGILRLPYRVRCWVSEQKNHDGKWVTQLRSNFPVDRAYYRYYDSFSRPQKGGSKGKAQVRPHQKYGPARLLAWFFFRNMGQFLPRAIGIVALAWLTIGGGGGKIMGGFVRGVSDNLVAGVFEDPDAPLQAGDSAVLLPDDSDSLPPLEAVETQQAASPSIPEPGPADVVALEKRVHELQVALAAQQLVNDAAVAEAVTAGEYAAAMRDLVADLFALRLITRDSMTLACGTTYRVGDTIDAGPHDGRVLSSIDWERRRVELDDGTTLSLARQSMPGTATLFDRIADVAPQLTPTP